MIVDRHSTACGANETDYVRPLFTQSERNARQSEKANTFYAFAVAAFLFSCAETMVS